MTSEPMNLKDIRSKVSGLHFAKECLSDLERQTLSLAEDLLKIVDERDRNYFLKYEEWKNEMKAVREYNRDLIDQRHNIYDAVTELFKDFK